jgi:peptidoglycan-associated lipoprotein
MAKNLLLSLSIIFFLAACSSDEEVETEIILPPEEELLPPIEDTEFNEMDGLGQGYGVDGISPDGMDALAAPTQEELVAVAGDRIFFATDRSDLTYEAMDVLRRQAGWLLQNPNVTITIEGHCDERGTREYNLALGDRRANSVKTFLVQQGVSPSRVTTISYGKEFPEFLGSNKSAWAKNRRAVTVVN